MSLDVYLYETVKCPNCDCILEPERCVYESNITHNLGTMAEVAGIYLHLWGPEELQIKTAKELIEPLTDGLKRLKLNPDFYKQFDSPNGWGLYKHFVPWVENYLNACKEYPDARISVSR